MRDKAANEFFDAVFHRSFGRCTCFLCGRRLGSRNRSDEHVIPKWVQNRFDLWNQRIVLPNGTSSPYRQLTIPCCRDCNNGCLQPVETRVCQAVGKGAKGVRDLDPRDLFVWLGKIFYGMLYRDLFLPLDVTGQKPGRIASRTLLQAFRTHHLFLQCVRVPMDFPGFFPASVLVVHTQEPQDIRFRWDFRDNYATMFIGCRLGSVGIVAALQDGGAQQQLFASLGVKRLKLHPLQFTELMAQVLYKARLFNRVPKYVTIDTDPKTVVQASLQGLSSKPVFDEWNPSHYAQILSQLTGFRLENVFLPPDAVMSWLRNSDRRLRKMPLEQYPIELLYGV